MNVQPATVELDLLVQFDVYMAFVMTAIQRVSGRDSDEMPSSKKKKKKVSRAESAVKSTIAPSKPSPSRFERILGYLKELSTDQLTQLIQEASKQVGLKTKELQDLISKQSMLSPETKEL